MPLKQQRRLLFASFGASAPYHASEPKGTSKAKHDDYIKSKKNNLRSCSWFSEAFMNGEMDKEAHMLRDLEKKLMPLAQMPRIAGRISCPGHFE